MAICRAHVEALGGNALVAYQLTECIIEDNLHKNQVYMYTQLYSTISGGGTNLHKNQVYMYTQLYSTISGGGH